MNYQPEARIPRAVDRADNGFGYNRPSAYGAGLVDLPGAFVPSFSSPTFWLLNLLKHLDVWLIALTRLILISTVASFVTLLAWVYVARAIPCDAV